LSIEDFIEGKQEFYDAASLDSKSAPYRTDFIYIINLNLKISYSLSQILSVAVILSITYM